MFEVLQSYLHRLREYYQHLVKICENRLNISSKSTRNQQKSMVAFRRCRNHPITNPSGDVMKKHLIFCSAILASTAISTLAETTEEKISRIRSGKHRDFELVIAFGKQLKREQKVSEVGTDEISRDELLSLEDFTLDLDITSCMLYEFWNKFFDKNNKSNGYIHYRHDMLTRDFVRFDKMLFDDSFNTLILFIESCKNLDKLIVEENDYDPLCTRNSRHETKKLILSNILCEVTKSFSGLKSLKTTSVNSKNEEIIRLFRGLANRENNYVNEN